MTEKFTNKDAATMSPMAWVALYRVTERAGNGESFKCAGRVVVAHRSNEREGRCARCCFEGATEMCDIVCCMPYERRAQNYAYYTIEPKGKEVSHE